MHRTARPPALLLGLSRRLSRSTAAAEPPAEPAEDILPPVAKPRSATALLEALSRVSATPMFSFMPRDTRLSPGTIPTYQVLYLARQRGRQAARYFLLNYPDAFSNFNVEEPPVVAFRPRFSRDRVGHPSDAALSRLVSLGAVDEAWEMLGVLEKKAPDTVTSTTRLRLLDLLAMGNDQSPRVLEVQPEEIYLGAERRPSHNPQTEPDTWEEAGRAQQLFDRLEGSERGPGFRALIRGMVRHCAYERALMTHRQMRAEGFVGDKESYNATLRCVHTVKYRTEVTPEKVTLTHWPWREGIELLKEMRYFNIQPNAETFNALIFSLSFTALDSSVRPKTAVSCLTAVLKEMEALGIRPNIGTFTNTMRLLINSCQLSNIKISDDWVDEANKTMIPRELKKVYSELLHKMIRSLNNESDRQRFATIYDLPAITLTRQCLAHVDEPTKFVLQVNKLLMSSPSLISNMQAYLFYNENMLYFLADKSPNDAILFYDQSKSEVMWIKTQVKRKLIKCFMRVAPKRLDELFLDFTSDFYLFEVSNNTDFLNFLHLTCEHTRLFPEHRVVILRAVRQLWFRFTLSLDPLSVPSYHLFLFLAACLPDEPSAQTANSPGLAEGTDLAWHIVSDLIDKEQPVRMAALHKFLQLGMNLVALDRSAEGAKLLHLALAQRRQVNEHSLDEGAAVVAQLLRQPLVGALEAEDPALVARLRAHADGTEPAFVRGDPLHETREDISKFKVNAALLRRNLQKGQGSKRVAKSREDLWRMDLEDTDQDASGPRTDQDASRPRRQGRPRKRKMAEK